MAKKCLIWIYQTNLSQSRKLLTVYIIDKYKYEQVLHEIHKDFAHSVSIVQMC